MAALTATVAVPARSGGIHNGSITTMRKIAIVLAAGSAFAAGACSKGTQDNAAATFNAASNDLGAAGDNAAASIDTTADNLGAKTGSALDSAGDHISNAADDAAAWTSNAMQATGNTVHDAGRDIRK